MEKQWTQNSQHSVEVGRMPPPDFKISYKTAWDGEGGGRGEQDGEHM